MQILDAPVPQVVDSAMDFFRRLHLPVAEQVIDVPLISSSFCHSREVLREPQMRNSWWTCRSSTLSSCSSTILFRRLVLLVEANKVFSQDRVRWASRSMTGFSGGLQGFLPRQSALQRTAEQITDTPVLGGVRHSFPPDLHPSALPVLLGEPVHVFFRTFPQIKKRRPDLRTLGRSCPRTPAHARRQLMLCPWCLRRRRRRRRRRTMPMCQTPLSGSSSAAAVAGPITGTDAPMRLAGSHRLVSRWCGLAGEGRTTGTRKRRSVRMPSLRCLLVDARGRVRGYWHPLTPSWVPMLEAL